jgi:hypothetical protein
MRINSHRRCIFYASPNLFPRYEVIGDAVFTHLLCERVIGDAFLQTRVSNNPHIGDTFFRSTSPSVSYEELKKEKKEK